jgi:galactonate dehydratase
MKVKALETIRLKQIPNILWVQVLTDEGLCGLGETFFGAEAVEAYLHEFCAPRLLGADPLEIERVKQRLTGYVGRRGSGVETRGNSAIDIALWDLLGQACSQPVYQMLGGRTRPSIRIYNTCAGYDYVRDGTAQHVDNWGLGRARGPYDDLDAFLYRADELAASLLEQGISGMKIWPFDLPAQRHGGAYISPAEMDAALQPFRRIRKAVGSAMDIMVEFHSMWNLPMAQRIAQRLAEFDTFWHEDPIAMDSLANLRAYAPHSKAMICASETLSYTHGFRDLLDTGVVGVLMLDIGWCGGITEARKAAAMAEAHALPVAPHDCVGPVMLHASTHLSLHAPNAMVQETVRAFYTGWYRDYVTDLPIIERGEINLPHKPGLGLALQPDVRRREGASVRSSTA